MHPSVVFGDARDMGEVPGSSVALGVLRYTSES